MSNYDIIAPYYDRISRLVFGTKLKDAQLYLIHQIKPGSTVLIVGGGDGWVLEAIARHCKQGISINYIDSSEKMIALAKGRNIGRNEVNYITAKVEDVALPKMYDYVFTAFLFDNFLQDFCIRIFNKISGHLRPEGLWLYADFTNTNNRVHWLLLRSMYLFFGFFCGVESNKLPDMESLFCKDDYTCNDTKCWMGGFIKAQVFEKADKI